MALVLRPHPLRGVVRPELRLVSCCHVFDVDKDLVAALAVPDLPPCVAGVLQDRADDYLRPGPLVPMTVSRGVMGTGRGDAVHCQTAGGGEVAVARKVLGEDALHDGRGYQVRFESLEALAVRRLARVRVWPGVGE